MASNLRIIGSIALDLGISVVACPVALFAFGLFGGPVGALIQVMLVSQLPVWYAVVLLVAATVSLSSNYVSSRSRARLKWGGPYLAMAGTLLLGLITATTGAVQRAAILSEYYQVAFAFAVCTYGVWRFRSKLMLAKQSK